MLLSFKSWSKSLSSRSCTRRRASRSNHVGQTESLERRDLLSALPSDGPAGTWQGAADSPFVRWNPDLQFSSPSSLAVADLNNDGHSDLIVGTDDPTGGNLWVLDGRGNGTFSSSRRTGEPGLATAIAAADFDRDGRVDIVEANPTRNVVSVFRQTTDGGFAGPFSSNVGEFNHARALLAASLPGGGPSALLIAHDINMGGGLDRVSMTGVGNLDPGGIHFGGHWFFNAGIGHGPAAMAVGDFDLDGRQEVAVANAGDNSVALAYSNGSAMGVSQTIEVGRTPLGIVSGDFNGDGQPDIATANFGDGSISILLDHNGSLVRQPDISGIVARAIATADFNGDGRLDLATVGWTSELVAEDFGDEILYSHRMTDVVCLSYGNGDGTFAEPIVVELGTSEIEDGEQSGYVGPSALAVVDLNEDGRPDLAVANPGRGIVSILLNQPPVVPINAPPIADDQSLVIDENNSVTITLTGRDPEGQPVELASFESAEHGTLDTTDDPLTWIYTPNANFVGDDHFTFSVSDGTLESATATISIQVNPVTPPPPPSGEQSVQTRAYVANLRSDFVSVIDTATNVVVQQIPIGFGQVGIDVSPDGMRAYATLMDSSDVAADHPWGRVSDVAVIDTVAGSVLTTIHTAAPYIADITVSPRGDIVLLTDHFNNVVRVLSTANNSIVASIPVGSAPDQVAFSPDGRLAYVSNILSWTVSVIDTATLTVVATVGGVGAGANTVCVSPDGGRVYVGSHWNGVSVIDTSSNTVIANLPLNAPNGPVVAMALTPDGTKLYVTDRHHSSQTPNNVWVVNTATNSVEARMTVDAGFDGGLVVSSDGAVLYVSAATNNTVLAIDTATNQILTAIPVGQVPHSIATGTISILVVDSTPPSSAAPVISMSGLEPDGMATDEDVPTNEILLDVGDADTPTDDLVVTVQSSNPELVPEEGIVLSGSGSTRTLVLTPAANQYGFATIVVSASDGEQTTESTFELTVRPVNDVPTVSELPELTIEEDTVFDGFEFGVGDVETAAEDLIVTATSLAPWLIATEDIVVSGFGADRHISFTPQPNAFGEGDVLVEVSDGTDSQQVVMHVTVLPVNDLPTISAIDDQVTDEDVATSPISFTIGDLETDADNLSITVMSSDPSLIAEGSIIIEGSGAERSLILAPAANQYGSATITVLISDGEATITREFLLTVNPVNDAPMLSPIANQTTEMEITSPSISLTIGDVDNDAESESLTLRAHSSNPTLIPNANIHFGGHGEQRNLTVTPAANQYGPATITVTLSDGETEVSQTFTLTVLHSHLKLTLTGSQSLQLSAGVDGRVIALINGAANSTAKTFLASELRMLTITGGTGANRIDLSAVQPAKFVNLSRVNVDGGAGNDTLIGSGVSDSLLGGAGNDSLLGGGGNDLLDGQAGLDTLTGGAGNDTLDGGVGVDLLVESTDVNVVLTSSQMIGLGTDAVRNLESARLTGGASANRFDAAGFTGTVTLIGNAGNDTLIGGSANDLLQGGDGADSIQGNAGNDIIDGGTGHDTLLGGDGNDTLTGGTGDDALAGGLGNDKLTGDLGNDTLLGAAGNDSLQGGLGNDVLIGGTGNDTLVGQGGADTLAGAGYGRARDTGDRLTNDSLDRIDESFAITFAWADLV